MKKICLFIWIMCLFCVICSVNGSAFATEVSQYDELTYIYQNEYERKIEEQNYYESLLSQVEENWLEEDESGKMYWAISSEEISQIEPELVNFLNNSMDEKNQLIDNSIIKQSDDGEIELSDEIEDNYYVQAGSIEFVQRYKKVWFVTIWIGFDMICNNAVASIVISSLGILLDLVGILKDISIIWKTPDIAINLAKTYCYSLHTVVRELSTLLQGVPSYILSGVEIMWKSLVIGTSGIFGLVIAGLKLGFPKTLQALDIIKHASSGHGVKFTYTTVCFTRYTIL